MARLLGASDFLWEDFLRRQHDHLLPLLHDYRDAPLITPRATLSYGGLKMSGMGKENTLEAMLDHFTSSKTVIINPGISDRTCPYCLEGDHPLCIRYGILGAFAGGGIVIGTAPCRSVPRRPLPGGFILLDLLRRRLSYANVVASLALFVALMVLIVRRLR